MDSSNEEKLNSKQKRAEARRADVNGVLLTGETGLLGNSGFCVADYAPEAIERQKEVFLSHPQVKKLVEILNDFPENSLHVDCGIDFGTIQYKNGMSLQEYLFAESYLATGNVLEALYLARFYAVYRQVLSYRKKFFAQQIEEKVQQNSIYIFRYKEALAKFFNDHPAIKDYIQKKLRRIFRLRGFDSETLINELMSIATFNIKDAMSWNSSGVELKNSDELPDEVSMCVKSVQEIKIAGGHKTVRVEFYDKMQALKLLSEIMGLSAGTLTNAQSAVINNFYGNNIVNASSNESDRLEDLESELRRCGLLPVGGQNKDIHTPLDASIVEDVTPASLLVPSKTPEEEELTPDPFLS